MDGLTVINFLFLTDMRQGKEAGFSPQSSAADEESELNFLDEYSSVVGSFNVLRNKLNLFKTKAKPSKLNTLKRWIEAQ